MPANTSSACFVDTNIWLYAFINAQDSTKSSMARQLLQASQPVVSIQVINGICVNLLKRAIFSEEQIRLLIESFYEKYEVVELTQTAQLRASVLRERYSLSFWDSMIVASGLDASVPILYSEDMQHGLVIEKQLQIVNPFVASE